VTAATTRPTRPTQTVKHADTWSAACVNIDCRYWESHDRRTGDLRDPTPNAAEHVALTRHHVTVAHTVRIITELEPAVAA